jgi:hypothetical protein
MFAAKGAAFGAARRGGSWASIGRESELACLRMHIEQWLKLPATVVVVFDGNQQPAVKRGRQVRADAIHQLEPGFRKLANAAGFHCYTVGPIGFDVFRNKFNYSKGTGRGRSLSRNAEPYWPR